MICSCTIKVGNMRSELYNQIETSIRNRIINIELNQHPTRDDIRYAIKDNEAIVARQCGLRVAGISCITNMGAGISKNPLTHEEVKETADKVRDQFVMIIQQLIPRLDNDNANKILLLGDNDEY